MKPSLKTLAALLLVAASLAPAALRADDPTPTPTPAAETPLHEIGATPTPAAQKKADGAWLVGIGTAPTNGAAPTPTPLPPINHIQRHNHDVDDHDRVAVDEEAYVAPGETVPGNAIAVFGPLTVDGTVDGNAVSVMGSGRIDGTVHGNAVVVMGTMRLGPNAHIDGNAVAVGGVLLKDPGAYVGGTLVPVGPGVNMNPDSGPVSWWDHGLRRGRPLAFGPHLHLLWIFSLVLLALYAVLATVFPGGVKKCGETLAHRPGLTFLSGILGIIALPIIFVLLLCTVVGIPIALIVLPLGVVGAIAFGKTAIYSLVGRSIVKQPLHPGLAALLGGVIFLLVYLVPFLGLTVWAIVAFLGFSCAVATLLSPVRPVAPAAPVVPLVPGAPMAAGADAATPAIVLPLAVDPAAAVSEAVPAEAGASPAPVLPPVVLAAPVPPVIPAALVQASEAALPKAGFWVRIAALAVDAILIAIVTQAHDIFLPTLAAYGAVLWKFKGSTLGGIIFHLKVVRLDARPMDWPTSLVRALGCFISLVVIGLGFVWIAFDPEKQAWHDKIAGTVVVRLPKSVPLV